MLSPNWDAFGEPGVVVRSFQRKYNGQSLFISPQVSSNILTTSAEKREKKNQIIWKSNNAHDISSVEKTKQVIYDSMNLWRSPKYWPHFSCTSALPAMWRMYFIDRARRLYWDNIRLRSWQCRSSTAKSAQKRRKADALQVWSQAKLG